MANLLACSLLVDLAMPRGRLLLSRRPFQHLQGSLFMIDLFIFNLCNERNTNRPEAQGSFSCAQFLSATDTRLVQVGVGAGTVSFSDVANCSRLVASQFTLTVALSKCFCGCERLVIVYI